MKESIHYSQINLFSICLVIVIPFVLSLDTPSRSTPNICFFLNQCSNATLNICGLQCLVRLQAA